MAASASPSPTLSSDAKSTLSVCERLLPSLAIGVDAGCKQFESTLHPSGHMANPRYFRGKGILFHSLIPGLVEYTADAWTNEIDGTPTVLVDHDTAMVRTPYWVRVYGELSHVGTNCFNLVKVYQDGERSEGSEEGGREWEWKVVMACDTARLPTDEERKRLDEEYSAR